MKLSDHRFDDKLRNHSITNKSELLMSEFAFRRLFIEQESTSFLAVTGYRCMFMWPIFLFLMIHFASKEMFVPVFILCYLPFFTLGYYIYSSINSLFRKDHSIVVSESKMAWLAYLFSFFFGFVSLKATIALVSSIPPVLIVMLVLIVVPMADVLFLGVLLCFAPLKRKLENTNRFKRLEIKMLYLYAIDALK